MLIEIAQGTTAAELDRMRQPILHQLRQIDAVKVCCGACQHFELGKCELHGEVPIAFQKQENACADWRYDGVPF